MMGLTPQQRRLVDVIRDYTGRHCIPPSMREMAAGLGLANQGQVHAMLIRLEARGAIRRMANTPRAIEIIEDDPFGGVSTEALVAELARRGWSDPIGAVA